MTPRERLRNELNEHGFASAAVLHANGIRPSDVLDLTSIGNSVGAPQAVLDAMARAPLRAHPDPQAAAARESIAVALATTPSAILLGHGAEELLWSCGRVLARAGESVLSIMPGQTKLAQAARISGARTLQWRAVERTGHSVDLEQVAELIQLESPALVSLATPAAISGVTVAFSDVLALAARFPRSLFVIDQSELTLSDQHSDASIAPAENVVCVRSIGVELGLPGLRAGFLWARPELCARLAEQRPGFAISAVVQAASEAAFADRSFVADGRLRLAADRARLAQLLSALELTASSSVAPALLVRIARASEVAEELLIEHRVAVRDCTAYGLPDHLRIAALTAEHEDRLRTALTAVLSRRKLRAGRET